MRDFHAFAACSLGSNSNVQSSKVREVIAEVGNSREKAQQAQERALFPQLLRLLRLFAASSAIGSRSSEFQVGCSMLGVGCLQHAIVRQVAGFRTGQHKWGWVVRESYSKLQAIQRAFGLVQCHAWNGLHVDHCRFGCQLGEEWAQARGHGWGMALLVAKVEVEAHSLVVVRTLVCRHLCLIQSPLKGRR
jgi:hypothetical protein